MTFFVFSGSYFGSGTYLFELSGQRYFVTSREKVNWDEAWSDCNSFNAKLVRIDSAELQLKLERELPKYGYYCYWTAGYWDRTKDNIFTWNSGNLSLRKYIFHKMINAKPVFCLHPSRKKQCFTHHIIRGIHVTLYYWLTVQYPATLPSDYCIFSHN